MDPEDEKTSLHDTFDRKGGKEGKVAHPHKDSILAQACNVLRQSQTGDHLLNISDSYGIALTVTPEPEQLGFIPEENLIRIAAPIEQNHITAHQLFEIAGGLRDAEQAILGFSATRTDLPPEELEAHNHAKNLDIMVDLCRITEELKDTMPELENELFAMGIKPVFQAFKDQAGEDALIKAYEAVVKENKK